MEKSSLNVTAGNTVMKEGVVGVQDNGGTVIVEGKRCKDFDNPVTSGYSFDVYHATINKNAVCNEGLKPSKDVAVKALGQGHDNKGLISFTTDKIVGMAIAKDLKTFVGIANGTITPDTIEQALDESDDDGRYFRLGGKVGVLPLSKPPSSIWRTVISDPDEKELKAVEARTGIGRGSLMDVMHDARERQYTFEMLKRGLVQVTDRDHGSVKAYRENVDPAAMPCYHDRDEDDDSSTSCVMARGTDDEQRFQLFKLWRSAYLPARQYYNGRPDPYFSYSTHTKGAKTLKTSDVGLFKARAYLPVRCFGYTDKLGRETAFTCFNKRKVTNEGGESTEGFDIGEDINKEVKISRDRFTRLEEIPFENVSIPAVVFKM